MTVFNFMKYALIFTSLFGLIFVGIGAWKAWYSYNFARLAQVKEGIFIGYHLQHTQSTTLDDSSTESYHMVEEYIPMFKYTDDSGRSHHITGKEGHFFRHLRNKVNEPVTILVLPDNSQEPRLGDVLSLYCSGVLLGLTGFIFFILPMYGVKLINRRMAHVAAVISEDTESAISFFDRLGQSQLPANDLVIVLGGFFLIAGSVMGYAYYYFSKRQDMSLIQAIKNNDVKQAHMLAVKGRGVDAMDTDGESALIKAIKAGHSELASAIINNLWVNTHAKDADGTSAIQLAAQKGDFRALTLLLKKGEQIYDIKPPAIYQLIKKNDTETLKLIIEKGLDLNQTYAGPAYGDQAVLWGRGDVVKLIRQHNGLFQSPEIFIALATQDEDALRKALKDPKALSRKFRGLSLEKFANKIGQTDLLENVSRK